MRVLLVNAFHYLRGGVERTYLDESRWLTRAGHEVAHLATRDPRNLASPTSYLFAPAADYGEGASMLANPSQWGRVFWSLPAERAMTRVLEVFRPEIAHVHAPSRYLTPSVLRPLERAGVPVVMTLHDFKPWCTNRTLFAHGAPCERCRGGRHYQALRTGCVQESRARSAVAMVEAYVHEALHAYRPVRLWIAPSTFVRDKVAWLGLDPSRVRVLSHGMEPEGGVARTASRQDDASSSPAEPYALFLGRLSAEKGVTLLEEIAARIAPVPLRVAGDGPLRAAVDQAAQRQRNLEVLGWRAGEDLARLRREAAAVVLPSLFYETFCYVAAEALLDARPVVAARIGAVPELIEHEVTGLLAPAGDGAALGEALKRALEDPHSQHRAEAGRERVLKLTDPARHLEGLLGIYAEAMGVRETVAAR